MSGRYRHSSLTPSTWLDVIPVLDRVQGKHSTTRLLDAEDVKRALDLHRDFSRFGGCWVEVTGGTQPHWCDHPLPTTTITITPRGKCDVRREPAKRHIRESGKQWAIHLENVTAASPLPVKYRGFYRTVHAAHGSEAGGGPMVTYREIGE